jgi:hypothetical protein
MKKIIKKILREEIGYHIVSIQYLGRKPLNEGTNYEHIDDEILKLIKQTYIVQKILAKEISPLLGQYTDKKTNQVKEAYFNIKINRHFSERNFREQTFPSDPNFVNPKIDEGINIVKVNIDNIWKMISLQKLGYKDVLRLKSINGVNYEILVSLNTLGKLDKLPIYDITLYNQMKGNGKHFNRETKIIKTYNPLG